MERAPLEENDAPGEDDISIRHRRARSARAALSEIDKDEVHLASIR